MQQPRGSPQVHRGDRLRARRARRHLLIEDLETGDVMMPLIDLKPVFHANYSRKVSALKNRLVAAPAGSELLAARLPGCTLFWQWAFEAPPVVKDVIRRELGAENMSSVRVLGHQLCRKPGPGACALCVSGRARCCLALGTPVGVTYSRHALCPGCMATFSWCCCCCRACLACIAHAITAESPRVTGTDRQGCHCSERRRKLVPQPTMHSSYTVSIALAAQGHAHDGKVPVGCRATCGWCCCRLCTMRWQRRRRRASCRCSTRLRRRCAAPATTRCSSTRQGRQRCPAERPSAHTPSCHKGSCCMAAVRAQVVFNARGEHMPHACCQGCMC